MRKGTDTDLIKDRQNMREVVVSRDRGGDERRVCYPLYLLLL